MSWTLTDDPETYAHQVLPLLRARPDSNTLALTVLDTLLAGQRWAEGPVVLGWHTDAGTVTGAVSMTPPYGLALAEVPAGSEAGLVAALRAADVHVPDVGGKVADVERFVECWTAGTDLGTSLIVRQRLYSLATLQWPIPAPAGSARLAELADLELVLKWMADFRVDAEPESAVPPREVYQRRIELRLFWFWLDEAGQPVSCAGRNPTIAGMSRVGPVYTPKRFRRQGYGEAVTAACTQDAIDGGAQTLVLFTDLANPTSNAIYQRLGYRAQDDRLILRFVE